MQHRPLPDRSCENLLVKTIIALAFPFVLAKVLSKLAWNYLKYGIALLTPVEWNEAEEALLCDAIAHGYSPRQLRFTFWWREKDIAAKAEQMGLLTPETKRP